MAFFLHSVQLHLVQTDVTHTEHELTRHTELWELRPKNREEANCCFSCSGSGVGVVVDGVWLRGLSPSACWPGERRGLGTST